MRRGRWSVWGGRGRGRGCGGDWGNGGFDVCYCMMMVWAVDHTVWRELSDCERFLFGVWGMGFHLFVLGVGFSFCLSGENRCVPALCSVSFIMKRIGNFQFQSPFTNIHCYRHSKHNGCWYFAKFLGALKWLGKTAISRLEFRRSKTSERV